MAEILCADTNPATRDFYRETLESPEYQIRVCENTEHLLIEFQERPADLVILEMAEPDLAGLEVCKAIREIPGAQEIPIIAVLSSYHELLALEAIRVGADDCLLKPFSADTLLLRTLLVLERTSHSVANVGFVEGGLFAGTYEIVRVIGEGSYSTVYLARDVVKSKEQSLFVALKVYDPEGHSGSEESYRAIFLREAYAMSKLDHPVIAHFYDFGKADQAYYLAMEYVRGQSLLEQVKNEGVLTELRLLEIAIDMAGALQYLGERQIVHRDIKPNNILISETNEIKLVDFGLAKQQTDATRTAQPGTFHGTPEYVSPEQIRGESLDVRSDIYSLGATLYYAACGQPPFRGKSSLEKVIANLETDPLPLHEQNPAISSGFSCVIHRMMAKNCLFRYQPLELLNDLRLLQKHE